MEPSRCSALFMAALFSLYTVAALKIVLARGSCDIFPTQRLAFDRSSGDIVLPRRLVWLGVPMISFSSFFFALF